MTRPMEGAAAKLRTRVEIEVGEDVPHREITAATNAGVEAANAALGAPVEAIGSLGSARNGKRSVRIELAMRGAPAIAMAAERAFAEAFVARLVGRGFAAERA